MNNIEFIMSVGSIIVMAGFQVGMGLIIFMQTPRQRAYRNFALFETTYAGWYFAQLLVVILLYTDVLDNSSGLFLARTISIFSLLHATWLLRGTLFYLGKWQDKRWQWFGNIHLSWTILCILLLTLFWDVFFQHLIAEFDPRTGFITNYYTVFADFSFALICFAIGFCQLLIAYGVTLYLLINSDMHRTAWISQVFYLVGIVMIIIPQLSAYTPWVSFAASILYAYAILHKSFFNPVLRKNHELAMAYADIERQVERRTAELERSRLFLQRMLDTLPTPIFYKDREGRYVRFNRAFLDQVSGIDENWLGKTMFDVGVQAEVATQYHQNDLDLIAGSGKQVHESLVDYKDGTQRTVIAYKATFEEADGSVGGIIGTFLDITAQKKLEQELADANDALEVQIGQLSAALKRESLLSEEKDDLIEMVAHDLRGPLSAVILNIEFMISFLTQSRSDRSDRSDLIVKKLKDALLETNKMHKTVKRILDVSKLENQGIVAQCEPVSPINLITQCIKTHQISANARSIDLVFNTIDPDEQFENRQVVADGHLLALALENLVSNAIKYSPDDTMITITLQWEADHAKICIHDQGLGLTLEDKLKLFRKFPDIRTKPVRREDSSTGLGLYIVKWFVELMDGTVEGDSPGLNQGCVFTIKMPRYVTDSPR